MQAAGEHLPLHLLHLRQASGQQGARRQVADTHAGGQGQVAGVRRRMVVVVG